MYKNGSWSFFQINAFTWSVFETGICTWSIFHWRDRVLKIPLFSRKQTQSSLLENNELHILLHRFSLKESDFTNTQKFFGKKKRVGR